VARQDVIDEVLYLRSAGLDLGKRFLLACVRVPNPKRQGTWSLETERFGTTPAEVRRLLAWLTERRVELVVMEATSDYWGGSGTGAAALIGGRARSLGNRTVPVGSFFSVAVGVSDGLCKEILLN
jgi:hypothetical protein